MLQQLQTGTIHKICSGQVITDLSTAVKELVENSLDAGASKIEIKLKENGLESFEVGDDASGIRASELAYLMKRYHTSKIKDFEDIDGIKSFGFRGEALSSLLSLCPDDNVIVVTRSDEDTVGKRILFERNGDIKSETLVARERGTTITVSGLFESIPVRRKEFQRTIKNQFAKMLLTLQGYAIIAKGVRISCVNTSGKTRRVLFNTSGSSNWKDNITSICGINIVRQLIDIDFELLSQKQLMERENDLNREESALDSQEYDDTPTRNKNGDEDAEEPSQESGDARIRLSGYVSKFGEGVGSTTNDRQFWYINGRPVELPKFTKLLNTVWRQHEMKHKPAFFLDWTLPPGMYDINVNPNKRDVFMVNEVILLTQLQTMFEKLWQRQSCLVSQSVPDQVSKDGKISFPTLSKVSTREDIQEVVHTKDAETMDLPEGPTASNHDDLDDVTDVVTTRDVVAISPHESEDEEIPEPTQLVPESHGEDKIDEEEEQEEEEEEEEETVQRNRQKSENLIMDTTIPKIQREKLTSYIATPAVPNVTDTVVPVRDIRTRNYLPNCFSSLNKVPAVEKESSPASNCFQSSASFKTRDVLEKDDVVESDSSDTDSESEPLQESARMEGITTDTHPTGTVIDASMDSESDLEDTFTVREPIILEESVQENAIAEIPNGPENTENHSQISTKTVDEPATVHVYESEKPRFELDDEIEEEDSPMIIESDDDEVTVAEVPVQTTASPLTIKRNFDVSIESIQQELESFKRRRTLVSQTHTTSTGVHEEGSSNVDSVNTGVKSQVFAKSDFATTDILGQFNKGFIIGKFENHLFIFDQHACDEKYRFETLQHTTKIKLQPLLRNFPLELGAAEIEVIRENLDIFEWNGFRFAPIEESDTKISLTAIPRSFQVEFGAEDVRELASILMDHPPPPQALRKQLGYVPPRLPRSRAMFASRACRSAIMIGDSLDRNKMRSVLNKMTDLDQPWNCPHGRPTMRHLGSLQDAYSKRSSRGDSYIFFDTL